MEKQSRKTRKIPQNRKIVIGICTFHRNHFLDGTLESLSRMDLPEDATVELVLVDNDKDGGARELFEDYREILPFSSHYVIEPRQGIAYARNRILDEALGLNATEIAMVDDDEIVSQQWLTALWDFYKDSFFAGVSGPMYRLLPPGTDETLLRFWKNYQPYAPGQERVLYCNNCLFSTNIVRPDKMNIRFDTFFNQIGGEDAMFTISAALKGAKFVHVAEAITIERFPESRATFSYMIKRHLGSGGVLPLIRKRALKKAAPGFFLVSCQNWFYVYF